MSIVGYESLCWDNRIVANVSRRLREGWELVRGTDLPSEYDFTQQLIRKLKTCWFSLYRRTTLSKNTNRNQAMKEMLIMSNRHLQEKKMPHLDNTMFNESSKRWSAMLSTILIEKIRRYFWEKVIHYLN
jgi:hypothetical protein